MNQNKLKPCPFCGEKPRMRKGDNSLGEPFFQVRHDCMKLLSEIKTFCYTTEDLAISAWNNRHEPSNDPLTLDELRQMDGEPLKHWVWIENLAKPNESAYFRTISDYTEGEAFCCGYPGFGTHFEYKDYGETWIAYRFKPKEDKQCF